jgi:hypothetical protein
VHERGGELRASSSEKWCAGCERRAGDTVAQVLNGAEIANGIRMETSGY